MPLLLYPVEGVLSRRRRGDRGHDGDETDDEEGEPDDEADGAIHAPDVRWENGDLLSLGDSSQGSDVGRGNLVWWRASEEWNQGGEPMGKAAQAAHCVWQEQECRDYTRCPKLIPMHSAER